VNDETLKLMNEIDCVFTKYPFFGSRHRVRRLMGLMGLQAIYRGPNTRCPAAHAKHV
jgi:putative transposase